VRLASGALVRVQHGSSGAPAVGDVVHLQLVGVAVAVRPVEGS
jgi:putative spermidine/putrescine transport system ATP-binding protein